VRKEERKGEGGGEKKEGGGEKKGRRGWKWFISSYTTFTLYSMKEEKGVHVEGGGKKKGKKRREDVAVSYPFTSKLLTSNLKEFLKRGRGEEGKRGEKKEGEEKGEKTYDSVEFVFFWYPRSTFVLFLYYIKRGGMKGEEGGGGKERKYGRVIN